ncbi:MAG: S-methyl-5'-thioadenosine phosphorylase [Candidatus Omnitrophota bacterium]|nr:S-methyl-5'-thioadenosine phosphorylase [Candidatus Omnitrophota bacterium]
MNMIRIGIIGGSGLYDIEGLRNRKPQKVSTPFGEPSGEFTLGELEGKEVVFLPRHGQGHKMLPGEINYRANIFAMKKLGVGRIISIGAVGSLREELKPLDMVIPGQFADRTNQARKTTFFGDGIAAHISFADPVCPELCEVLHEAGKKAGAVMHKGGTYLNMEGPAFSTRAESILYKKWGMDVIGMTNMAEARLAREAEICFSTLAMVTDYDCWHASEDVSVDIIIQNLIKNTGMAKRIVKEVVRNIPEKRNCACGFSLKNAIITAKDAISVSTRKKLDIIVGKYLE